MEQAIVSYLPPLSIENDMYAIETELSAIDGFRGIVKTIGADNAVVANVEDSLIEEWIQAVRVKDHIDYCIRNYSLTTFSYQEQVLSNQLPQDEINPFELRSRHRMENPRTAKGIKVGAIDTGISNHPYLYSRTFKECYNNRDRWHQIIRGNHYVETVVQKLAAIEPVVGDSDYSSFVDHAKSELSKLSNALWEESHRQIKQRNRVDDLDFLVDHGICGLLGLISLDSRSYVSGTNQYDITDTAGHGTSMASIFSGFEQTNNLVDEHPLLPLSLNMATHSELVVLKCMGHPQGSINERFDAMLEALDHAASIDLDILYIGIGFIESDFGARKIKALEKRLKILRETHDCCVICAAGNDLSELAFPAAVEYSTAISSVNFSGQTFTLNSHSAFCGHEDDEIEFCAFGGDDSSVPNRQNLLPSLHYGFALNMGTSVSAAIATAIMCAYKSQQVNRKIRENASLNVRLDDPKEFADTICKRELSLEELLKEMRGQAFGCSSGYIGKFGSGLIRYPLDSY